MYTKKTKKQQQGFSLLEVTVVIAMLGILVGVGAGNLWYGRKKALMDKDILSLTGNIYQTKKYSLSIKQTADVSSLPEPDFNDTFLGYAIHLQVNDPNYTIYEVWTNPQQTPAAFSQTIPQRKKTTTLEWTSIVQISPEAGDNSIDFLYKKLTGSVVSSAGFSPETDSVELIIRSKNDTSLERKMYISNGGYVTDQPPIAVATNTPTPAP
ncbi:MAG: type II secretion system protein [bacterium]